jgi:hypothetical protein
MHGDPESAPVMPKPRVKEHVIRVLQLSAGYDVHQRTEGGSLDASAFIGTNSVKPTYQD